jgi:predicted CoA-binding protein
MQNVVILGASDNPSRYSFLAFQSLKKHGHTPFLVSPTLTDLEGAKVFHDLSEVNIKADTLTMYVNPKISTELKTKILKLKPTRVIFNPGTENPALQNELEKAGIEVVEACTLVMLRTGQFG